MKKIIFILLCVFIYLNADSSESKKITLQLLWKHQFEFAGFYMAKEKGFYKEYGFDVEFKEYEFGLNIAKEVSEGKSEFGVDSTALILDKIKGLDVYMLMPILQTSPFVLLSKKRDDLKTVSDLAGKRIMVTPNQITMASLNAMFKINNLSSDDFISQVHSFNTQDLIDDKTDAISSYISNEPYYLIEKNIPYTIFNPADYGFSFYDNVLFTSKALAKKNPKMVKDFYEASKKGWDYAFDNIEESVRVIIEKYNTQNKSFAHLVYEAEQLRKLSHFGSKEYQKFKPEVLAQIVQTYNLLDISKSNVDMDELIYPDAMYVESSIDYGFIWKVAIGVLVLFLGLFYWNRKLSSLNNEIKQSKNKISILLNNAGQGFLTFNKNFLVDEEYSHECVKLLGEDIANKDISKLLFKDESRQKIFKDALLNAIDEPVKIKKESYLSLLPSLIILNKRALKLEYKILDKQDFMLVITNITMEKKLEKKIKKEQQTFKMIVTIVSESDVFYDTKKEYLEFIENFDKYIDMEKEALYNINNIYRAIHTFKGSFSQLFMNEIVEFLHKLENSIASLIKDNSKSNEKLLEILQNTRFRENLDKTLGVIDDILGDEFIESQNYLKVDIENINELQEKISRVMAEHMDTSPACEEILSKVQSLSSLKLVSLLKPYTIYTKQLANRLQKEIYDFNILGDTNIEIGLGAKPFIKSLVHIFRNSIDHGIEDMDSRVLKKKDEIGSISCSINKIEDKIHIIIADDGMGIDMELLKQKAKLLNIDTSSMDDEQILQLVFKDNFSTKSDVSDISGRGVGLSSVMQECEKLGAEVKIFSKKDTGTTFEFVIPKGV